MAEFDQIFASDPNNPQNVAENGVLSIYAPGTRSLLSLKTVTGDPLSNPLQLNGRGFGPAFMVDGFTEVAWEAVAPGEVFTGTFKSYKGVLEETIAAKAAAQGALAAVPARIQEAVASGDFRGPAGKDGSNVLPTQEAVVQAQDLVDPLAVRDGVTNTLAALQAADAAAVAAGTALVLRTGVHRVTGSVTLNAQIVVQPGAILKPSNGTVITINGSVDVPARRFIDMSLGGVVVLANVPQFLPEWWGPTGTSFGGDNANADDSETWRKMLVSASYLPTQQSILPRAGISRLWQITLNNVHIDAKGGTRRFLPPLGATSGNPTTGTGFVVRLMGNTKIDGGSWETGGISGVTVIYWEGSRCSIDNFSMDVSGADTVGVWAKSAVGGSITPVMSSGFISATRGAPAGVGIRCDSPDGEFDHIRIAYLKRGMEILRGAIDLQSIHVWECTEYNVYLFGANGTKFNACYIEKCDGWGIYADATSFMEMDSATRFWLNGRVTPNTGAMLIRANPGASSEDNNINATFDDNPGTALHLINTQRTKGKLHFISAANREAVRTSTKVNAALGTTGVVVDSASYGTDLHIVTTDSATGAKPHFAPVTGKLVDNQSGQHTQIRFGSRVNRTTVPITIGGASGSYTSGYATGAFLLMGIGHLVRFTATLVLEAPASNDLKVRIRTNAAAVGMSGWFALTTAYDAVTPTSLIPSAVRDITTDGSTNVTIGGTGQKQLVKIEGYVNMGSAYSTLEIQVGLQTPPTDNAGLGSIHYSELKVERIF